jgi:hypothetical protein
MINIFAYTLSIPNVEQKSTKFVNGIFNDHSPSTQYLCDRVPLLNARGCRRLYSSR